MKKRTTLSEAQHAGRMDEFIRQEQARLDREKNAAKAIALKHHQETMAHFTEVEGRGNETA